MPDEYNALTKTEWEKFTDTKNKLLPNIMLLGKSGCGKSSLINVVFGKDLAKVSDTDRGTVEFKTFYGRDCGLDVNLIDSRGYEMENGGEESFNAYFEAIKNKIAKSQEADPYSKIHIIWYCISVAGKRVQPYDIEILRLLNRQPELRGRVAVIITKCDKDTKDRKITGEFKRIIENDVGDLPVFDVSNNPNLRLGLDNLIDWSANSLNDEDLKEAFIASQMLDLKAKRQAVAKRIAYYTAAAAGIGAVPIPLSDAALLTPLQIIMATNIIYIYGLQNVASISTAVIGNVVAANLGKALAGGLLKLIPFAGQIVGGMINAGVASGITAAFGFAISEICYDACKRVSKGEPVDFSNIFNIETIKKYVRDFMDNAKKAVKVEDENMATAGKLKDFIVEYLKKYKTN